MITDAEIREQGYVYFLAEAPELLQTIEQELLSLTEEEDKRKNKVHALMRATHTLKGGAATVGLEAIQTIAHSLEDVFKALYNPDIVIDNDLHTLLLKAYECLRLALTTTLTSSAANVQEVIERATNIFAQLQVRLGDDFGTDNYLPTSQELGFDVVKSIFEVGVQQRIENITETINHPPEEAEFRDFVNSQAEIFLGLAESLDLLGLEELAQKIMAALQAYPSQVMEIAELMRHDLQTIQTAVFAGDRTCTNLLSPAWQNLTPVIEPEQLSPGFPDNSTTENLQQAAAEFYQFLTTSGNYKHEQIQPTTAKFYLKLVQCILSWFEQQQQIPPAELNLSLLIPKLDIEPQINYIETWLKEFLAFVQNSEDSYSLCLYRHGMILIVLLAIAQFEYGNDKGDDYVLLTRYLQKQIITLAKEYKNYPPVNSQEKNWLEHLPFQNIAVANETVNSLEAETEYLLESIWGEETANEPAVILDDAVPESASVDAITEVVSNIREQLEDKNSQVVKSQKFVRVDVEKLRNLNYLAGELLIYHKKRHLYDEQIQELIDKLLEQINRHQIILHQLRDIPLNLPTVTPQLSQNFAAVKFDSLEMDVYTEFNLALHAAIEETLQLQETTESLDLTIKQATQATEKKQNLVFTIIDNLVEARMLPLGDILHRFPPMVKKLGSIYQKNVELQLIGTDVLVDKAIAEKLYDPLLHLVRNAFDHGIESPQIRQERGKPEQGLITIRAYHQSSQTIIEVQDDGEGLNLTKIHQKAIEMKLDISGNNESELLDLMFAPGLSTAAEVSNISGRGIGLDIVRSQIEALHGSIAVQTLPQKGTKFTLKIPFSMTTDKLMLVQAGGVIYALLLDSVEKIIIPTPQQIKEFEGKKVLYWHTEQDETLIGLHELSELMSYTCSVAKSNSLNNLATTLETKLMNNPILILKCHQGIFALEVDQIIGEQELVIRPLGNAIAPPKYVYGCSTSANGNLILVIDGALLLDSTHIQVTPELIPLPIIPANESAVATSEDLSISIPAKPLSPQLEANFSAPKVVLIVDDAISLRQTLSLTLQRDGYQVIQAQNGVEALEQLQKYPDIQVIISDLEMPRMNGFELLTNVQQIPNIAKIPVVILSSRSADKHRQLAKELGARAYLTKPYLEQEFLSTISSLIQQKSGTNNLVMELTV
ncbi:hybrid sensor histidine kinase/response regulator [Nostoc sp. FACHB-87]|uniref:hybrid sensor histidine kinase/response regulator n=1 Tax=Nostocaceae TaxID=1162 RepID=UPI00168459BA|nr:MULTISPECIES: hybrid sensor histidine kinase/response regulator [Nostocaceae]MBD2456814.1 hybrid sensor histidine kinase/response regulator [Nostoc sp. FACHB-87]MBD2476417.1 hybrid sensor histidine kinase/response regulator [Anabaena sp. FACHB-83]